MLSRTALGLPGRLIMRVWPLTPAIPLVSAVVGTRSRTAALIASGIPGISNSSTALVASGVLSLGAGPVPPVVRIRSRLSLSDQLLRIPEIVFSSSGWISTRSHATSNSGRASRLATMAGPLRSSYSPLEARSLRVRTPALTFIVLIVLRSGDGITEVDSPTGENLHEDPFTGHDAITGLMVDGAAIVALFADLGNFYKSIFS